MATPVRWAYQKGKKRTFEEKNEKHRFKLFIRPPSGLLPFLPSEWHTLRGSSMWSEG
jgi:hypothetical protein